MSLIEIKLEPTVVERGVKALERIAHALEEYMFPHPRPSGKPAGPENLTEFDWEAEWLREQEDEKRASLGLPPR